MTAASTLAQQKLDNYIRIIKQYPRCMRDKQTFSRAWTNAKKVTNVVKFPDSIPGSIRH